MDVVGQPSPPTKHILPTHLQPIHDLLETPQGDALFTVLQTEQRAPGESCLLGEGGKRHLSALFFEEFGELLVQE